MFLISSRSKFNLVSWGQSAHPGYSDPITQSIIALVFSMTEKPILAEIGPWLKHSERTVYETPWIKVTHEEVTTPTGTDGIYGKVHFKNRALGVIAVDDEGYTWLVGQHRYSLDEWSWEIPEGGGKMDETSLEGIQREFQEETGLQAEHWSELMTLHTSNCVSDEKAWIYVATGVSLNEAGVNPDDTERLEVKRLKLEDAIVMAINNEITDGMSVAGLLKLQVMLAGDYSIEKINSLFLDMGSE